MAGIIGMKRRVSSNFNDEHDLSKWNDICLITTLAKDMKDTIQVLGSWMFFVLISLSCNQQGSKSDESKDQATDIEVSTLQSPYLVVLGIAQDAGFPQMNCQKSCCKALWGNPDLQKMVSCIGLVDPISKERWIFDATPDFPEQVDLINQVSGIDRDELPSGIFLTHAHIGHYTGLMHLGREAVGAKEMPVFAMDKMSSYLTNNGPWSQLVSLKNIALQKLLDGQSIRLNERLKVTPFLVPHRDEYSETVGYKIEGPNKSAIFIPDINKWGDWEQDINQVIQENDLAFLDGSFYKNGEIPNRDMSQIPHPFMEESMSQFESLSAADKKKVHFIHFNHTNPVLQRESDAAREVEKANYRIARERETYGL